MTFSDYDAASLCRALYFFDGDPRVSWDLLSLSNPQGVAFGIKGGPDGVDNIVFRGTDNFPDAWRDLEILPTEAQGRYAALGFVHGGFFDGIPEIVEKIIARNPRGNIRVMGHSLGAAHGQLFAECMHLEGLDSLEVYLFGEPPSTRSQPRPARSWRNGSDPVCSPPLWPYVVRKNWLYLNVPPAENDDWGSFLGWHHIESYERGLAKLQAPAPIIVEALYSKEEAMTPVQFIEKLEGDDSRHLGGGLFGATWDPYGKCWNIGPGLTKGVTESTKWTQAQIDAALDAELKETEDCVDRAVKVPIGQNERTVLISFAYNIGVSGFLHSSVLSVLNAGHHEQVPSRLSLYVNAKGVRVQGLINRRNQEIALWNRPDNHPPLPVEAVSAGKADPHPAIQTSAQIPVTSEPMEPDMPIIPASTPTTAAPAVNATVPVASSSAVVPTAVNNLLTFITAAATFITTSGIDFTSLVNTVSHGNFWAGLLATGAAAAVKHVLVSNSNNATISAIANAASSGAAVVASAAAAVQAATSSVKAATSSVNPASA